jgi:hypothetical protein
MTINNPKGTHEFYTSTDRHWHAGSEAYTGGDSLLTALRNGWQLLNLAYEQMLEVRGGRSVAVLYFHLVQGSDRIVMPILVNPFVERLLIDRKIMVRSMRETAPQVQNTHSNSPTTVLVRA